MLPLNGERSRGLWRCARGLNYDEEAGMRAARNLGIIFLGIWLIVTSLLQVVSILIPHISVVLPFLGLAAGVLILIGR